MALDTEIVGAFVSDFRRVAVLLAGMTAACTSGPVVPETTRVYIDAVVTEDVRAAADARGAPVDGVVQAPHDATADASAPPVDGGPVPAVDLGEAVSVDAAPAVAVCGNGVVEDPETCDEPDPACVDCRIPCDHEGGRACGQNGIPGDAGTLFECRQGERVPIEHCAFGCLALPLGTPDRCQSAPGTVVVPPGLVDALDAHPYVEEDCEPAQVARWPYDAQRCTYSAGPLTTTVVVANPPAERVAAWIVNAATLMPAVEALKDTDPAAYEAALIVVAEAVMGQSSRIFPLEGGIIENMGGGYIDYPFRDGVTEGCSTGCYCRINSLHRTEFCAYQQATGERSSEACLDAVGRAGLTDAWAAECLGNHIAAFTADRNDHFRAKAFIYQQSMQRTCAEAGDCSAAAVVDALREAVR